MGAECLKMNEWKKKEKKEQFVYLQHFIAHGK